MNFGPGLLLAALLVACTVFPGCQGTQAARTSTGQITFLDEQDRAGFYFLTLVRVRGCDYVALSTNHGASLLHAQDCPNPTHRGTR
jgi:hypothetical protein